jgi:alpha-N-acetylglucosamine transferase
MVTEEVPQYQRDRFAKDGAQVVLVEDVPLKWWTRTRVTEWKDHFTKLRLLEMMQYDRILYIDAVALLTRRIDGIFDEPMVRHPAETKFDRLPQIRGDEAPLPANYMFAARSDNGLAGKMKHPFPPSKTKAFNAGFWVVAPSEELFRYLMSVMEHLLRFDLHEMEQSLLNYALRREGAMPWAELDYRWNADYVNMKDYEGGVVALHEKLWKTGPDHLKDLWKSWKMRKEEHYNS